MKKLSIIVLFWLFTLNTYGQIVGFHRIAIDSSRANLELFQASGLGSLLYLSDGEYFAELSDDDLKILAEKDVAYTVKIRNVSEFYEQRNLGKSPALITSAFKQREDYDVPENFSLGSMGGFCTYDEINANLDSMHVFFPGLISAREPLPTCSAQGNPIYWVKISDNPELDEEEPEIFYNSLIHAREPVSVQQLLYFMYHILENYGSDDEITRIIQNTELYFILCINPDGYLYNEALFPDGGGMWRKNRSPNINGSHGIDPNRNFGYMWGYDDIGSSPVPQSSTYRGEYPWSAPEVQAIKDFAETREFKLVMNYHSFGELLLYSWGYVSYYLPDDYDQIRDKASLLTQNNYFDFGTAPHHLYLVNGDATDWFYGENEQKPAAFAYTPEVGCADDGFWPPMEEIIPQCNSCLEMNILAAQLAGGHVEIFDAGPVNNDKTEGYLTFYLKRNGLTDFQMELSAFPLNNVFDTLGSPQIIENSSDGTMMIDSVFYRLKNGMKPGNEIKYVLKIENDAFFLTDTMTKFFGPEQVLFSDVFDDLIHWETDTWAYNNNYFTSPQFSASNVEGSYYANNEQSYMYFRDTIIISDADVVWVNFDARWDLDGGRDYVKFVYSTDFGQSWNVTGGRYSTQYQSGSENILVYEGKTAAWISEWILFEEIRDVPLRFGFQFTSDDKYGRSGFYCDDFRVVTVDMQLSEQAFPIEQGWTAISSFIIPENIDVETILEGHINDISFMSDNILFYQPGNNNSLLTEWNTDDGYFIKAAQPFTLIMSGYPEQSNRVVLVSGWNLVSVLSNVPVDVYSLSTEPPEMVQIIKEACGSAAHWPEKDINSLQQLLPGKSYFIKSTDGAVLIFN